MAARSPVKTPEPQKFTFTLGLDPSATNHAKKVKDGKTAEQSYGDVQLTMPPHSWKNVNVGDLVQFVPNPKLRGARIMVRFVSGKRSEKPKSPFDVNMIRSSAFHKVVKQRSRFWVRCIVVTSDGKRHGEDYGGRVVCDLPPCH